MRDLGLQATVVVFTDDARRDLAGLNGHRLVYNTLLLCVITHFDMARGGKVFAKWVPNKAIVGQDAAQVSVAFKDDAKQVKGLALKPHKEATTGTSSSAANTFKRTRWFKLTDSRWETMP
jgi:hypothetical protein